MNTTDLITAIQAGEIDKLKSVLEVSKYAYFITDAFSNTQLGIPFNKDAFHVKDFKEYNPRQHEVHNESTRKDKIITDEQNQITDIVKVARLSIPEQKKIVLMASAFLGSPELVATPKEGIETDLLEIINTISEDNKLNYKFMEITKKTMSERECAELWYTQAAEQDYWDGTALEGNKFKLRMRILSPSLGDTLYPIWDEFGDMIAFSRYYETITESIDGVLTSSLGNKILHFDIYTADRFYFMTKDSAEADWVSSTDPNSNTVGIANPIGKIPVVYYSQPTTEWHDVQGLIDRLEKKLSNLADTNDYFDSPIMIASGAIKGFADKGEQGKLLELENGADLKYLTWDNAPEAMKLEIETLVSNIGLYTHTPNISLDNIKTMGKLTNLGLKLLFMDAHLKAMDKEELFGQGVQRRNNFIKATVIAFDQKFKAAKRLKITPEFNYWIPKDDDGDIATLIAAYQAGIISLETAVKRNPLIEDAIEEMALIKAETDAKDAKAAQIAIDNAALNAKNTPPTSNL